MINIYLYTFIDFSFALSILFFVGWKLSLMKIWTKSKVKKSSKQFYDSSTISVVIPFRNEEKNLQILLESISKLHPIPKEIIFVNDHSDDNSVNMIENFDLEFPKVVLNLEESDFGKKKALRQGINFCSGDFILCWDADIKVKKDFFASLEKTAISEILLLPVKMKGKNLLSFFAEIDFYYINNLNVSCFGLFKPILANGANLLFNKNSFLKNDSIQKHGQITSGDDVFILNDFKRDKKSVSMSLDRNLIVDTNAPSDFNEFVMQRLRWIKKTNRVGDSFANFIGILGILYHIGFLLLFILIDYSFAVILLKMLLDVIVLTSFLFKIKHSLLLVFVPLFSIIYPFYIFFIAVSSLFVKPEWKERVLYK